jgi:glucosamine--fructose-6-phosphate aminotransferase (isomerizing)
MCGILAYLGLKPGSKYVLEGIKILRNRGYDSVGCCSLKPTSTQQCSADQPRVTSSNSTSTTKYANTPDQDSFTKFEETFDQHHSDSNLLMAHCRWATCGQVSEENSHPHSDTQTQKLHLVHNGIITNHEEVRHFLQNQNSPVAFQSETDTETIVNLISYYHAQTPKELNSTADLIPAIQQALNQMEGTWGLVIINQETPDTLYVCRKGSPILVAYSEEMCLVSSEISGFSNYLKNYLVIPDGEILKITLNREKKKIKIHSHLKSIRSKHNGSILSVSGLYTIS